MSGFRVGDDCNEFLASWSRYSLKPNPRRMPDSDKQQQDLSHRKDVSTAQNVVAAKGQVLVRRIACWKILDSNHSCPLTNWRVLGAHLKC